MFKMIQVICLTVLLPEGELGTLCFTPTHLAFLILFLFFE